MLTFQSDGDQLTIKPVDDRVVLTLESEGLAHSNYTAFSLNRDQVEQVMEFLQGWQKLQGE